MIEATEEEWEQLMDSLERALDPTDYYSVVDHNELVTSIIDRHIIEDLRKLVNENDNHS